LWLHSLKVAQLLRSAACLHTNQSRSYLNHLVIDIETNASRYASNTEKQLVLISSKGHGKYSQEIENIWLRNSLQRIVK